MSTEGAEEWREGRQRAHEAKTHEDEQRQANAARLDSLAQSGAITPGQWAQGTHDLYQHEPAESRIGRIGRGLERVFGQGKRADAQKAEADKKLAAQFSPKKDLAGIEAGATSVKELQGEAQRRQIEVEKAKHPDRAPYKEFTSPDGKTRQWFRPGDEPEGWNATQGGGSPESDYQKAVVAARQAKQLLDQAKFDAAQDPSNPVTKAKLQAAQANKEKADAYMMRAQASTFGSVNGQPLPGAMETDEGKPIGSAFQSNVRPTGKQREQATLATSALEQLHDMEGILKKRGELFGPGAGRAQQLAQWIGSPDPDAQRFTAAVTTAADHLMGVFGGRSTYAGQRIEKAIGQMKTDPEAALAAIQQMGKAATLIQGIGSYKTVGGDKASPTGGKNGPAPKKDSTA